MLKIFRALISWRYIFVRPIVYEKNLTGVKLRWRLSNESCVSAATTCTSAFGRLPICRGRSRTGRFPCALPASTVCMARAYSSLRLSLWSPRRSLQRSLEKEWTATVILSDQEARPWGRGTSVEPWLYLRTRVKCAYRKKMI